MASTRSLFYQPLTIDFLNSAIELCVYHTYIYRIRSTFSQNPHKLLRGGAKHCCYTYGRSQDTFKAWYAAFLRYGFSLRQSTQYTEDSYASLYTARQGKFTGIVHVASLARNCEVQAAAVPWAATARKKSCKSSMAYTVHLNHRITIQKDRELVESHNYSSFSLNLLKQY